MKRAALLAIIMLPTIAAAQYRALETDDDLRRRRQADRYEQDRDRGYRGEPLGGYRRSDELGPRGSDSIIEPIRRRDQVDEQRTPDRLRGGGYLEPVVPRRRD